MSFVTLTSKNSSGATDEIRARYQRQLTPLEQKRNELINIYKSTSSSNNGESTTQTTDPAQIQEQLKNTEAQMAQIQAEMQTEIAATEQHNNSSGQNAGLNSLG